VVRNDAAVCVHGLGSAERDRTPVAQQARGARDVAGGPGQEVGLHLQRDGRVAGTMDRHQGDPERHVRKRHAAAALQHASRTIVVRPRGQPQRGGAGFDGDGLKPPPRPERRSAQDLVGVSDRDAGCHILNLHTSGMQIKARAREGPVWMT
jgi:hypothetical protein